MSSVEYLREFVNERLTAAAEEIFGVFIKTVAEYEEEIDRQRRLLDICWKPQIKLHRIELPQQHVCTEKEVLANQELCDQERNSGLDQEDPGPPQIKEGHEEFSAVCNENRFLFQSQVHKKLKLTELPQQHVCKEEEVLAEQQLCNQERSSSVDQEDPEPPQIKEEQEELWTSQEGDHFVLKQETDTFMSTPTHEESDHSEDRTLYVNPDKTLSATGEDSEVNILLESSLGSEANSDLQLLSHSSHVAENRETRNIEPKQNSQQHKNKSHSTTVYNPTISKIDHNNHTDKKTLKCDTCGKDFKYKSKLQRHLTSHTDEKPYTCTICGRAFKQSGDLTVHVRSAHTGDKPYLCKTCGKGFTVMSKLKRHTKIHTDEKPYLCSTCGTTFRDFTVLMRHMRVHTGEMPYTCKICGRAFRFRNALSIHTRTHTGEKPYTCNTCGRSFTHSGNLTVHMRFHTGEKPYLCNTCGKTFIDSSHLAQHIKTHAGK